MTVRTDQRAFVHPDAEIAEDVEIGPFSTVGPHVKIGRGTRIGPNCTISGHTTIGENNHFLGSAAIGGPPQDLKYNGESSELIIGNDNVVREFVTLNIGTETGGGATRIGSGCMLMACCHVAHDCILEDRVILSNNVLLGGHVLVESDVIVSGASVVHHFATLGRHSFIGGMTRVSRDVPPYMTYVGNPPKVVGINTVGLKRRGFDHDTMSALKETHRTFFRSALSFNEAVEESRDLIAMYPDVRVLVDMMKATQLGKFGRALEASRKFN